LFSNFQKITRITEALTRTIRRCKNRRRRENVKTNGKNETHGRKFPKKELKPYEAVFG